MTVCLGLRGTVPVYTCCPVTINSASFHSQKCTGLNVNLYSPLAKTGKVLITCLDEYSAIQLLLKC